MTNLSALDAVDGRPCPTPATEALEVFMTQHLRTQVDSQKDSPDPPPRMESKSRQLINNEADCTNPLDLSDLTRATVRVERRSYCGAASPSADDDDDDDAFPSIEWNSDDENDDESSASDENRLFVRHRRRRTRRGLHQASSSSSSSSLCDSATGTTLRKRRSGDALLPQCPLPRCKTRKMCLPGCVGSCNIPSSSFPVASTSLPSAETKRQLPKRQQSLSVGSSLDASCSSTGITSDFADAVFLAATLRTVASGDDYSLLPARTTSWGQFVASDSSSPSPSSPNNITLRRSPSRPGGGLHLKKTGSCSVLLRNNSSLCRPAATSMTLNAM